MEDKFLGLILTLPKSFKEVLEGYLYLLTPWGWEELSSKEEEEEIKIQIFFSNPKELERVLSHLTSNFPELKTETYFLPKQNWLENWKKFFTPVTINNTFIILPSWKKNNTKLTPIYIYPEMAFGTGHHPTTHLCLEAVAYLLKQKKITSQDTFLDLGTGSGILGIACAKMGLKGLGLDIDPHALNNAQKNIDKNNVNNNFTLKLGSIKSLDQETFSLILANILATPLIKMSSKIINHLKKTGFLILSGILNDQVKKVKSAYNLPGLNLYKELNLKEWAALIYHYE